MPSEHPSSGPSSKPSDQPSKQPSSTPSSKPSSTTRSAAPSTMPSENQSSEPSSKPNDQPSKQPSSTPIWTVIFAESFESGFGYINDGGSDARVLDSGTAYSLTGSKSLRLRDDAETSLSYTSLRITVSSYWTLKVEFWYKSKGFNENSDSFSLQFADGDRTGTDWVTKGTRTFITNNDWRFLASVEFAIDATTMRIQLMNNGDRNQRKSLR
jgi:hypothetical protein